MPVTSSRREFMVGLLGAGLASRLPIEVPAHRAAFGVAAPSAIGGFEASSSDVWRGECPECRGLGRITCPACDGTGMWTEASESAGLYQRESARAAGHCAWCNEWGEVACPSCDGGGGGVISSPADRRKLEIGRQYERMRKCGMI
jgi:hypothetical protein